MDPKPNLGPAPDPTTVPQKNESEVDDEGFQIALLKNFGSVYGTVLQGHFWCLVSYENVSDFTLIHLNGAISVTAKMD
jgi:hypothetical protein